METKLFTFKLASIKLLDSLSDNEQYFTQYEDGYAANQISKFCKRGKQLKKDAVFGEEILFPYQPPQCSHPFSFLEFNKDAIRCKLCNSMMNKK